MPVPRRIPRPRSASSPLAAGSDASGGPHPGDALVASPAPDVSGIDASAAPSLEPALQTAGRRSRSRAVTTPDPLGSLTQRDNRSGASCRDCGSLHVTRLSMHLTDGTPVDFTSCHRCEYRSWEHAGTELTVDSVLDRARKV